MFNFRKHRLVKPVSGLDMQNKLRDLQREEQNMFYLRYPYLTKVHSITWLKLNEYDNHNQFQIVGRIVWSFKRTRSV